MTISTCDPIQPQRRFVLSDWHWQKTKPNSPYCTGKVHWSQCSSAIDCRRIVNVLLLLFLVIKANGNITTASQNTESYQLSTPNSSPDSKVDVQLRCQNQAFLMAFQVSANHTRPSHQIMMVCKAHNSGHLQPIQMRPGPLRICISCQRTHHLDIQGTTVIVILRWWSCRNGSIGTVSHWKDGSIQSHN